MPAPSDRLYSESHEWHLVSGDVLTLGITQFAVDALTDVTYVEMKKPGTKVKAGETVGEVESVKTTSDMTRGLSSARKSSGSAFEISVSRRMSAPRSLTRLPCHG